jgi:hypothetical protein
MHASNSIIKFANDTTVIDLITNNGETAYREEARALGVWCQENNLTQRQQNKGDDCGLQETAEGAPPIHINGTVVERVVLRFKFLSFKFLGVHIT